MYCVAFFEKEDAVSSRVGGSEGDEVGEQATVAVVEVARKVGVDCCCKLLFYRTTVFRGYRSLPSTRADINRKTLYIPGVV